jgi:galactose-1-phosphate uridylyltransferase
MSLPEILFEELPDGSCRQWHPLHGMLVLGVPGREGRPLSHGRRAAPELAEPCDFCPGQELKTTPEKARLALQGGYPSLEERLPLARQAGPWLFRRFANLFEMVSSEYWRLNHGFEISERSVAWQAAYLADPAGLAHVQSRLAWRAERLGLPAPQGREALLRASAAFFGGGHDVLAAQAHGMAGQPSGSSDLGPALHHLYTAFSMAACRDLLMDIAPAKHVVLFQNWLGPAGASFEHLHKQAMAVDEWGPAITRAAGLLAQEPGAYQRLAVGFSKAQGLALMENRHALALVEPGQAWPTVAVYSKHAAQRPWDLAPEQMEGLSQLLWAAHAALAPRTPSNEEWIWAPRDLPCRLPIQVRLKARLHAAGGFEGATTWFINPQHPRAWRARLLEGLQALGKGGQLPGVRLGDSCDCAEGCLEYDRH